MNAHKQAINARISYKRLLHQSAPVFIYFTYRQLNYKHKLLVMFVIVCNYIKNTLIKGHNAACMKNCNQHEMLQCPLYCFRRFSKLKTKYNIKY
jgi:hypothetical protein